MNQHLKEPLLFLVHRIPFPPNKGDKIRSFHILQFLSRQYDVYLGAFIDDPQDEQYRSKVTAFCKNAHLEALNPAMAKIRSLSGLLSNNALSIPYYSSSEMQKWVNSTLQSHQIKKVLAFSSPMAQFVEHLSDGVLKIMDFVDIDSDKWKQYCKTHKGLMSWVYAREAKQLFKYEKHIACLFDASLFVSDQEAHMFKTLAPESAAKVHGVSNGVDTDYFTPDFSDNSPYQNNKKVLVFTGAMDYWANCDAVIWFANEIFPLLYKVDKNYEFYIVGSKPTETVQALSSLPGVTVTGRVEDIRPYIKYAHLCVAPLRIARGIQNKVLEAMAMGKAVVATSNAIEGIQLPEKLTQWVADSEQAQAKIIGKLADDKLRNTIEKEAGQWIKNSYSWDFTLKPLAQLMEKNG